MLQEERFNKLLTALAENGYLTTRHAQQLFGISPATVRRDFIEMERRNLVQRMRGGISARGEKSRSSPAALDYRKTRFALEKEAIGRRAAGLLRPHDIAILDGGTTTLQMARFITANPLTLITNSIEHATAISQTARDHPHIELNLIGGIVCRSWNLTYGPAALEDLSRYNAHWVFLSGQGLNSEGLFNPNSMVVEMQKAMIDRSEKVVVLAERSKIGAKSMSRVCGLDRVDILVTNREENGAPLELDFTRMGIEVIEAAP